MKYLIVVVAALIIVGLLMPMYVTYISGDIGMGKVLQHPFLKIKPLCSIVGGEFKSEVSGWSDSTFGYCVVKSKTICKLKGGEIKHSTNLDLADKTREEAKELILGSMFVGVEGGCYKKK
jgi:hypothetical protein